jgi:hypothetical protein
MSLVVRDDNKKYFINWQPTSSELQITEWTYTTYGGTPSRTKLVQTGTYSMYGSPYGSTSISGSWYDTTIQTSPGNTASKMYCDSTSYENGIEKKFDSNFEVQQAGKYNLQFSVQLDKASGSGEHIFIWFRKNGVDEPWSASEVAIQGTTAEQIPSWNYIFDLDAGDYVNVMWLATDEHVELKSVTAGPIVPAIPSVIITMWRL